MYSNHFLFRSGKWIGEGKVAFSFSQEKVPFTMQWVTYDQTDGFFLAVQTVAIEGQESMMNAFKILPGDDKHFTIDLENPTLGFFQGTGIVSPESIAWEFRHKGELDGYEVYERLSDDRYRLQAEYCGEDVRTVIVGELKRVD